MSKSKSVNIALIGEAMIQLQADPEGVIETSFAGDTLNTATYLARLSEVHHAKVHYITALGTDQFSQQMASDWKSEGIECEQIRLREDKLPGLYHINVDESGERSFLYWRNDSAAKQLFSPQTKPSVLSLAEFEYIYVSGISLAILDDLSRNRLIELIDKAKQMGSTICFDNNYRPKLWSDVETARHWYTRILRLTDLAFLTFDDEQALWGDKTTDDALERYRDFSFDELVIKCGDEPCRILSKGFDGTVPANNIAADKIVDTTAAGDSFSAGYLCGVLAGSDSAVNKATIGHALASTVIQHRGALIDNKYINDLMSTLPALVELKQ
jgi:2-dehydro-3-deoxygluconokinase